MSPRSIVISVFLLATLLFGASVMASVMTFADRINGQIVASLNTQGH